MWLLGVLREVYIDIMVLSKYLLVRVLSSVSLFRQVPHDLLHHSGMYSLGV